MRGAAVVETVREAKQWPTLHIDETQAEFVTNRNGAIAACDHNAFVLIGGAPAYSQLHFDEFLSRARLGDRDWRDEDDLQCLRWLQSAHNLPRFTLGQARNAARSVAFQRRRDSLREFISFLPAWDEAPRIDIAFSDAWGAPDTPLIRAASRNFFIALVARALQPGSQVDTLWVFEGPQGNFKSRSLRALGGSFHAEISAPIGTTDFQRELRGLWIAEMSELDSLQGREASTVKRLLSATSDRFVEKYALHAESYPRRAVAVATTNESVYWQDSTGARRLIPVPCKNIRLELIAANRLYWFAEARDRHASGCTWWDFPGISGEQEVRQLIDPWEDSLRSCILSNTRGYDRGAAMFWPQGWISSAAIMRDWLHLEPHQQGQASSSRLGKVMRRLGYVPKRSASGNERGWISDAEVNARAGVS